LGVRIEESWSQLGRIDGWWNGKKQNLPLKVIQKQMLSRAFVGDFSGQYRDAYASPGTGLS
jgi:hypothetical protein